MSNSLPIFFKIIFRHRYVPKVQSVLHPQLKDFLEFLNNSRTIPGNFPHDS